MGLNIYVYRIPTSVRDSEKYKDWDSSRYTGDDEFSTANFSENEWVKDGYDLYWRPKDFEAGRKWVRDNIIDVCQPRLLNILDAMEKDRFLFFFNDR